MEMLKIDKRSYFYVRVKAFINALKALNKTKKNFVGEALTNCYFSLNFATK